MVDVDVEVMASTGKIRSWVLALVTVGNYIYCTVFVCFSQTEPNGRFETQTKICLSISNHHPKHWQPSWSVRTALIAFMPTNPNGALGSLDYMKEQRPDLAVKSRETAPNFGSPDRQKLIDEIHEYMISKASPVPQPNSPESSEPPAAATEQSCETPVSPANTNAITEITEHEEQHHEVPLNENQLPCKLTFF
ncbi:ubiquitin-conjugating enzyme E2 32 [Helianthus annuus]|uniref:ubiquitin-conjugating enzyme E2 32 n=1 Tax=Helianthus annuus TaxID=4232 RepID=UPI000B900350|nr:ubiquitin-conjugating enzyme E2 32 [Helianthus annuus]